MQLIDWEEWSQDASLPRPHLRTGSEGEGISLEIPACLRPSEGKQLLSFISVHTAVAFEQILPCCSSSTLLLCCHCWAFHGVTAGKLVDTHTVLCSEHSWACGIPGIPQNAPLPRVITKIHSQFGLIKQLRDHTAVCRAHRASATHHSSTNDPGVPPPHAGAQQSSPILVSPSRGTAVAVLCGTLLQDTWYPVPETLPHTGPVHAEQLQYMHGTCRPWPYSTHAPTLQGIPTAGAGGQGEHECCVRHSDSSPIYLPCNVHSFVLLYHITLICILPTVTSPCRCNLAATEVVIYAGW